MKVEVAKNGEARHIPLTPTAVRVFESTPKESELIFQTTSNAIDYLGKDLDLSLLLII